MKTLHLLLTLFLIMLFASCSKEQSASKGVSILVNIMVENTQGQNLLDPFRPGHFKIEDIKKYDLVDGKEKLFYMANWNDPWGFRLVGEGEMTHLSLAPNIERTESNPTTTYIDWGNGDKDTLVCKMRTDSEGYYYFTEEVWFNGERVFPDQSQKYPGFAGRGFKIVK